MKTYALKQEVTEYYKDGVLSTEDDYDTIEVKTVYKVFKDDENYYAFRR